MRTILLLACLFLSRPIVCGADDAADTPVKDAAKTVTTTGTVTHITLEGSFWGIVGDDGKKYDPKELANGYQVEGTRVEFTAKILDGVASTHQWGTVVEITKIAEIEKAKAEEQKPKD